MQKVFSIAALLTLALVTTTYAHADTINTFTLSTVTQSGYVQGFIDIDVTTGIAGYGQFFFYVHEPPASAQQANYNGNFATSCLSCSEPPISHTTYLYTSTPDVSFAIEVAGDSLVGYTGGPLCTGIQCYGGGIGSFFRIGSGFFGDQQSLRPADLVLVATTTTPEPESLLLAGSGALAVAGVLRRKAHQSRFNGA